MDFQVYCSDLSDHLMLLNGLLINIFFNLIVPDAVSQLVLFYDFNIIYEP